MSSAPAAVDYDRVVSLVRSHFLVKEQFLREDGSVEFKLDWRPQDKGSFEQVWRELRPQGLVPFLRRAGDDTLLGVTKGAFRRRYNVRIALILFVATLTTVFLDGFLRSSDPCLFSTSTVPCVQQAFSLSPLQMGAVYGASLMGILGMHELGHKLAASRQGVRSSLPYFIPGVPTFMPTFGAVIISGEPPANRDRLFDLAFGGPLLGLAVTVVVSFALAPLTVVQYLTAAEAEAAFRGSQIIALNPSLLMNAIFTLAGVTREGMVLVVSPIAWASWLGFVLHFLNLLPAWQLDGGHMARAFLGIRAHRITTIASAGVLLLLGYWPMALFILLFSMRSVDFRPLDDVSALSARRKLVFLGALGLAVLSAPIPF
jgi:Zn-dependent protease